MSVGPAMGVVVSVAGTGMAQTGGSDTTHSRQAVTNQQRELESIAYADETAGIAATDGEDQQAHDRDADGRRPWEIGGKTPRQQPNDAECESSQLSEGAHGESGQQLDLKG